MRHPVELAAVHDSTAQHCAVAVHVLGGGVGHDVRAPLKGAAVDRRGEGVVHDQRHTVGVSSLGKLLNVQHGQGRVCDGLAQHHLGVGPECGVQFFLGAQRVHKGGIDSHLLHGDGDQVEGASVDGAGGHDVVPCLADIEQGKEVCSLTAAGQHCGRAAFQLADLLSHKVTGGVLQTRIEVAVSFQIEQLAHVLAGGILEGGGLDTGDLAGFAVAGGVTALHADGIAIHTTYSFTGFVHIAQFPVRGQNEERTPSVKAFRLWQYRKVFLFARGSLSGGAGARSATEGVTSAAAYRFWWPKQCPKSGTPEPSAPAK